MKLHLVYRYQPDHCPSDDDVTLLGAYTTAALAERARQLFATSDPIVELELDALPTAPDGLQRYLVEYDSEGQPLRRGGCPGTHVQLWPAADESRPGSARLVTFLLWAPDPAEADRRASLLFRATFPEGRAPLGSHFVHNPPPV